MAKAKLKIEQWAGVWKLNKETLHGDDVGRLFALTKPDEPFSGQPFVIAALVAACRTILITTCKLIDFCIDKKVDVF